MVHSNHLQPFHIVKSRLAFRSQKSFAPVGNERMKLSQTRRRVTSFLEKISVSGFFSSLIRPFPLNQQIWVWGQLFTKHKHEVKKTGRKVQINRYTCRYFVLWHGGQAQENVGECDSYNLRQVAVRANGLQDYDEESKDDKKPNGLEDGRDRGIEKIERKDWMEE